MAENVFDKLWLRLQYLYDTKGKGLPQSYSRNVDSFVCKQSSTIYTNFPMSIANSFREFVSYKRERHVCEGVIHSECYHENLTQSPGLNKGVQSKSLFIPRRNPCKTFVGYRWHSLYHEHCFGFSNIVTAYVHNSLCSFRYCVNSSKRKQIRRNHRITEGPVSSSACFVWVSCTFTCHQQPRPWPAASPVSSYDTTSRV